jgi:signal transduction histidine kinase
MAASIVHELRTPLSCTIAMQEMLQKHVAPVHREKFLDTSLSASRLMLSLVNDILDYSQLAHGKFEYTMQEFSVRDLVQECVNLIRVKAISANTKMEIDIEDNIPQRFHSDPLRIRQVLLNLLSNALKFSPNGTVRVSCTPCRTFAEDSPH